jgi:hypothetical protein
VPFYCHHPIPCENRFSQRNPPDLLQYPPHWTPRILLSLYNLFFSTARDIFQNTNIIISLKILQWVSLFLGLGSAELPWTMKLLKSDFTWYTLLLLRLEAYWLPSNSQLLILFSAIESWYTLKWACSCVCACPCTHTYTHTHYLFLSISILFISIHSNGPSSEKPSSMT